MFRIWIKSCKSLWVEWQSTTTTTIQSALNFYQCMEWTRSIWATGSYFQTFLVSLSVCVCARECACVYWSRFKCLPWTFRWISLLLALNTEYCTANLSVKYESGSFFSSPNLLPFDTFSKWKKKSSPNFEEIFETVFFSDLRIAFDLLDRNQDGRVTASELQFMLKNLGIEVRDELIDDLIKEATGHGGKNKTTNKSKPMFMGFLFSFRWIVA